MDSVTYKEIKDQYNRLQRTKEYIIEKKDLAKEIFQDHSFVVYIGCGSSYSLAKSMATSTMIHLNKKAVAIPAGDIMLRSHAYKDLFEGALVVALSRSGSTSEILIACDSMRKVCNFKLLSLSCRTNKELAQISDYSFEMPWAFDESVCQTSTVTNLYFAVIMMIAQNAQDKLFIESLNKMVEKGNGFISDNEQAFEKLARIDWDHGVTLGDAELNGICEEGALTFKEICQLPSNYYNLLDSRHGPMVIIGEKTLVIAVISDVENEYERSFIQDIKDQNCTLVIISDLPIEIDGIINFCVGEKVPYPVLGIPFITVSQLITCYKAHQTGVNPDKPNGLEPWITL